MCVTLGFSGIAFMTAVQLLPPRQRAVLILRDVIGYHASEVAQMLDSTEESVTSALKRARAKIAAALPEVTAPLPRSAAESTFWGTSGCQKLGQPVPDSNLVFELNNGASQQTHS